MVKRCPHYTPRHLGDFSYNNFRRAFEKPAVMPAASQITDMAGRAKARREVPDCNFASSMHLVKLWHQQSKRPNHQPSQTPSRRTKFGCALSKIERHSA